MQKGDKELTKVHAPGAIVSRYRDSFGLTVVVGPVQWHPKGTRHHSSADTSAWLDHTEDGWCQPTAILKSNGWIGSSWRPRWIAPSHLYTIDDLIVSMVVAAETEIARIERNLMNQIKYLQEMRKKYGTGADCS